MASLSFQSFLDKLKRNTGERFRSMQGRVRVWFRNEAAKIANPSGNALMNSDFVSGRHSSRKVPDEFYGQMLMFFYDPKWKEKLPYYDRFPLIFPIGKAKGGFLGINLHYLPPKQRAMLMDALYNDKMISANLTTEKRLVLSYGILKSAAKLRWFKPCVKHYLYSHVRSKFAVVEPEQWDMVLFMETARFEKASKAKVWRDSLKKANKQ
jgi:hypothetical protein